MSTSEIILFNGGTIYNCECGYIETPHTHTLRNGEAGQKGYKRGIYDNLLPTDYYKPKGNNPTTKVKESCDCNYCNYNRCHVFSSGPIGPDGLRGSYYNSILAGSYKPRGFIVIRNCTFCKCKEPHHHGVMEGPPGPDGEI